ncbi:hypothetical protein ANANG_G00099840 [Anguilla anguilla]|uniref:Uncharacterized protein n=1 Tax=Anguilla anguilla TaxID=7936 RepID=A0A9D3MGN6_ANGAN|nr:hypothetical protein ANANG_G00099840 [Anguilla anguilla]
MDTPLLFWMPILHLLFLHFLPSLKKKYHTHTYDAPWNVNLVNSDVGWEACSRAQIRRAFQGQYQESAGCPLLLRTPGPIKQPCLFPKTRTRSDNPGSGTGRGRRHCVWILRRMGCIEELSACGSPGLLGFIVQDRIGDGVGSQAVLGGMLGVSSLNACILS